MGTVTRFPQERVDYFRSTDYSRNAIILVLPVVRIERGDEHLTCEDAFSAMKDSFAQLHESLHDRHVPDC